MFMIRRSCLVWVATSNPKTLAVPSLGRSSVVRILMSVVLPAPFGPSRPKNSPGSTSRSMPSRATTVRGLTLYTRRIPRASIASGTAGCAEDGVVGNTSLGQAVRVAEYTATHPSGRPYQAAVSGRLAALR